jgi:hypothetical protein
MVTKNNQAQRSRAEEGSARSDRPRQASESSSQAEPPVSDAAVEAKTGHRWDDWFALMDRDGCARMTHKEIAAHLASERDLAPWWAQMVTVGYERARGMRQKHQNAEGFAASVGRTIRVPLERLYSAWSDPRLLNRWMPGVSFTVRKATDNRSMRISWADGSNVDAMFFDRGSEKSYVSLEQSRLPDSSSVLNAKRFWKERLNVLKELLEEPSPR